MLWQTSTGGRPVASVTRRTASSMALAYPSIEPSTGSRFTATCAWPAARRCPSQCSHTPRLHIRPCTSTTPLRPVGCAGNQSGGLRHHKGWRQPKINRAAPTSRHHARSSCAALAKGTASRRLRRCISTSSMASTAASPHSGSRAASNAQKGCCGHHHTKQAAPCSNAKSRKVV